MCLVMLDLCVLTGMFTSDEICVLVYCVFNYIYVLCLHVVIDVYHVSAYI